MILLRKVVEILTPQQRRAGLMLLGLMLVGMLLETLGVGMALPALALLTQGDLASISPTAERLMNLLGNPSPEQLAIAGVLTLVGVFALKTIFLAFLAWRQARFVFDLQADISHRLFHSYIRQPYTFHLQRNSAELISNVVNETNVFTHTGLLATMILMTEVLVILGVGTLLLYIEPIGALLVTGTTVAAAWTFFALTRTHLLRWGEARQRHERLRIKHLQQALGGIKDVRVLGREADFLFQYSQHNAGSALAGRRQNTLSQLPRLWLELLAIVGLAVLVFVMVVQGNPLESLIPTLGLFAAAAFRLMPSANRIVTAIQHMRYAMPVADLLHAELKRNTEVSATTKGVLPFNDALVLDGVSFRYADADSDALCDIRAHIARGTSVGFIGESGAGKSTLVDIVLGLLAPHSGKVTVDGADIHSNLRGWQDQIGYVPQSIFLTDDSVRRNVALGIPDEQIDDRMVWRALTCARLEDFVQQMPNGLDTVVGERGVRLSGGQRQRIGIARALYHDPTVLVLDEATSSLDVVTERAVMDAVQALHGEKTILVVAHRHSTVEQCDKLYRLDHGTVAQAGDPRQVLQSQPDFVGRAR